MLNAGGIVFSLMHKMNTIELNISNHFKEEKTYALKVLLCDILGCKISNINYHSSFDSEIIYNTQSRIVLKDSFWIDSINPYTIDNIPQSEKLLIHNLTLEKDLPILYGEPIINIDENRIKLMADLLASTFFLLSRWEEEISDVQDKYGRFPDDESFLIKRNLHFRPLVNEYACLLKNCLISLGVDQDVFSERSYIQTATHDVDFFARLDSFPKYLKAVAGDLVKRKSIRLAFQTSKSYSGLNAKDPYDTYSWLIELANDTNTNAIFFFIPGLLKEDTITYNINSARVINKVEQILNDGKKIGIHSSFNAFGNVDQLRIEKQRLEEISGQITSIRQHFLLSRQSETWKQYDNLGLTDDYSLSFHNNVGFRSGIANPYPAFDLKSKNVLNLKIHPTIIMDQALIRCCNSNIDDAIMIIKHLKNQCRKYNGEFVFLWHPENINVHEWKHYADILIPHLYS